MNKNQKRADETDSFFRGTAKSTGKTVIIDYTSWRGLRSNKRIRPTGIAYMSNEYHVKPCWMILAIDLDIDEDRTYPIKNIHSWREVE